MHALLILAGCLGVSAASVALWLEGRRIDRRLFAGLIALAVTTSLFSLVAWAATAVARIAPVPLTWAFVGTLAVLFALRLYRELQLTPRGEPR